MPNNLDDQVERVVAIAEREGCTFVEATWIMIREDAIQRMVDQARVPFNQQVSSKDLEWISRHYPGGSDASNIP